MQAAGAGHLLAKSGTGRFNLKGSNTYTGGTFVNAGDFRVIGTGGSPTGTGPVQVNEGRLSGKGIMAGAVTIGKGDGAGAVFNPGRHGTPALLGSKSTLNFKADGSYACVVDSNAMVAAEAIGNGITIDPAAHISLSDISATILPTGTSFTVINNIAATLISGTFANLPDGATITIGSNIFQANYEGGDGNDLTLTVVS